MEKQAEYKADRRSKIVRAKRIRPLQNFKEQYTPVKDEIFDYILPNVTLSEWAVLSLMIRKMPGWGKESDRISYSQFIKGTPIKSESTLSKALEGLADKGLILRHQSDRRFSVTYELNSTVEYTITLDKQVIW